MIFLIEYNRPEGQLVTFQRFQDSERLKAQDARLDLELDLNRKGVNHEVVLLEAASEAAVRVDDLKVPPSNRLHKLERDRSGQYSISVNDQWRICFRFVEGDAYEVELTDYH